MKSENLALGDLIWIFEENLAIDTAGPNQSWVQGFDLISGHDNFDIAAVIETVELVEEL